MKINNTTTLEYNVSAHDKIARKYEYIHYEIYNEIEQNRLKEELIQSIAYISTNSENKIALDFGCGAGNLTKHLTDIGLEVIASDISQGFLDLINSRIYSKKVTTLKLNGKNLSNIKDNSVDFIATYSVLHHVPDYLSVINEFYRILKKGGVIYIDHESSDSIWVKNENYKKFKSQAIIKNKFWFRKFFYLDNYIDFFIRLFFNSRYRREGDIHVFIDDHIEWSKIENLALSKGCELVKKKKYLLYKADYNLDIYNLYKDVLDDMQLIVFKKV